MTLRLSLNTLCHSKTCVRYKIDSPKQFCNAFNDYVAVIPCETQNFKQTLWLIFFRVKIGRHTIHAVNISSGLPSREKTSHEHKKMCY